MTATKATIGVCGAGAMGSGIAQIAASAGHPVVVFDRDDNALSRGRASIDKALGALVAKAKIGAGEAQEIGSRLRWAGSPSDLAGADLVIEAIIERADAKKQLFETLESVLAAAATIATNTSTLPVTALAAGLKRPSRFLGLHFFNPAPVMKLVEVIPGALTDARVVADARALMASWGKVAVTARDVPGFIVNRVARPFYGEAWRAWEEGAADAATIDFLARDLAGFRMGPFELGDLIGHDVNHASSVSVFSAYHGRTRFRPSLRQGQLVDAGRLGRKTGAGVFDYDGSAATPAPSFIPYKDEKSSAALLAPAGSGLASALGAGGLRVETADDMGHDYALYGDVGVAVSDGRTAGLRSEEERRSFLALDWAADYGKAQALAYSASDGAARAAALEIAAATGRRAVEVADRPGMIVARTCAQLANAGFDAVRDQVATADDIDAAMLGGVNYPIGPIAWARRFGLSATVRFLGYVAAETGDPIYAPSEALRTAARREA